MDAIIIESFGVGGLPACDNEEESFLSAAKELVKKGKLIVMATQVIHEGSDLGVYAVGKDAEEMGLLETGDMTLEAAVTKIMWILGQTRDPDTIRSMFETTIRYDRMF